MNLTFNNKNITIDKSTFEIVESPIVVYFNINQLNEEMMKELKTAIDIDKNETINDYAKHGLFWSGDIVIDNLCLNISLENGVFSYILSVDYYDSNNPILFGFVSVNIDLHQYDGYFKKIILNEVKSKMFDGE